MTYRTDEKIRSDVLFQLGWDARVRQTDIGVIVSDGVVTLTGTVASYASKIAAQEAAHRVTGVLDVANEIHVALAGDGEFRDSDIARAVRRSLEWSALVPDDQIQSTISNGWVTLEGTVECFSERNAAARAISHLNGVRGVTNNISVSARVDREKVRFLIEDVLERRANREARRIDVLVSGGKVTIRGGVSSLDEKKAILGAIGHAPGITCVEDQLSLDACE